jgi:hypothetical protein
MKQYFTRPTNHTSYCPPPAPAIATDGEDGAARTPLASGGTSADARWGGAGGLGSDAAGDPTSGASAHFNGGGGGGGAGSIVIRTTDGTSPGGGATYPNAPPLVAIETL